jgi:hypothetical protein
MNFGQAQPPRSAHGDSLIMSGMGYQSGSGILSLGLGGGEFGVVRTGIGSTSQSSKFLLPWFC